MPFSQSGFVGHQLNRQRSCTQHALMLETGFRHRWFSGLCKLSLSQSSRIDFHTHGLWLPEAFPIAISTKFHISWVVRAPTSVTNFTRRIFPHVSAIRLSTRLKPGSQYDDSLPFRSSPFSFCYATFFSFRCVVHNSMSCTRLSVDL